MFKRLILAVIRRRGWELQRRELGPALPPPDLSPDLSPEYEPEFVALYERCEPATMTSIERMYALYQAVRTFTRPLSPATWSSAVCGGAAARCWLH